MQRRRSALDGAALKSIDAIIKALEHIIEREQESYTRPANEHRLLIMRELLGVMVRAGAIKADAEQREEGGDG